MLRKYIIERDVPGIGSKSMMQLAKAAQVSNEALARIDNIQWQHSYVTGDKTFCVYLAENEDAVHEHARLSGFPANRVIEVTTIFDPSTERYGMMGGKVAAAA